MFFLFIIAALIAAVGAGLLITAVVSRNVAAGTGGMAAFLVGVIVTLLTCLTTVGTKDVGVVTSFGRPTGRDLPNGLHWKAPWRSVAELDGAIQPDTFRQADHNGIDVRIGDSTTATVDATIRWRIVPSQASVLYQDYRSDDVNESIRDSLVKTQFNAALNDVLGKYNPLQQVAQAAKSNQPATVTSTAPNLDRFSAQVRDSMDAHLQAASQNARSRGTQSRCGSCR